MFTKKEKIGTAYRRCYGILVHFVKHISRFFNRSKNKQKKKKETHIDTSKTGHTMKVVAIA